MKTSTHSPFRHFALLSLCLLILLFGCRKDETFTVTFHPNGGVGTMAAQVFTKNEAQKLNENRFSNGILFFEGWASSPSGNVIYSNGQNITVNSNFTLYARWVNSLPIYTLNYDINGASGDVPLSQSARSGDSLTLSSDNNFYKIGFTFEGWNTNSEGTGTNYSAASNYTILSDITLFANWSLIISGVPCPGTPTVTDCQGNVYNTVLIGNQCWTRENMKATKYDTQSERPNVEIINPSLLDTYRPYIRNSVLEHPDAGILYNWAAAVAKSRIDVYFPPFTTNRQGICPNGWHIPTDDEWYLMQFYLIDNGFNWDFSTTGNRLAKSLVELEPGDKGSWISFPKDGAPGSITDVGESKRNITGFSSLSVGYFNYVAACAEGYFTGYWSATIDQNNYFWARHIQNDVESFIRARNRNSVGLSVRCIKD